ncbi:MAG: hypothetical protein Q7R65_03825 [bacterium]|nr:hypothetical protein [bacterium]
MKIAIARSGKSPARERFTAHIFWKDDKPPSTPEGIKELMKKWGGTPVDQECIVVLDVNAAKPLAQIIRALDLLEENHAFASDRESWNIRDLLTAVIEGALSAVEESAKKNFKLIHRKIK